VSAVPALRVAIGEDHLLLRKGLARVLEHVGFAVVGEAGDAVRRVAAGGSALDPEVVARTVGRRRRDEAPRRPGSGVGPGVGAVTAGGVRAPTAGNG
jgi:hypothetical protein